MWHMLDVCSSTHSKFACWQLQQPQPQHHISHMRPRPRTVPLQAMHSCAHIGEIISRLLHADTLLLCFSVCAVFVTNTGQVWGQL